MIEHWRSRTGFILAALGSAIGLGNIWRFAFVAGENGGGAFIVVYLLAVFLLAAPLMLAEFVVGSSARGDIVAAFGAERAAGSWRFVGALMLLVSFAVLSYYAVVAGWALHYFAGAVVQLVRVSRDFADFESFVGHAATPVVWQLAFLAMTMGVVAVGVRQGIETLSRWLVPMLGVLVIGMAAYGLTLPGAARALEFLFAPDWARLREPGLYVAALGQAFFSIGVGFGVLATYASYAASKDASPRSTAWVCAGDTAFALVASLVAFPALFSFGMEPTQGPTLAFVTLPRVFAAMPLGHVLAVAFFFLLVIAALTSAVSLLEVTVAYAVRRFGWSRPHAAVAAGLAAAACGLPSAWSSSLLAGYAPLGRSVLGAVDFIAADVLLPLCALGLSLYAGWALPGVRSDAGSTRGLPGWWRAWRWAVRWPVPAVIAGLLVWSVTA